MSLAATAQAFLRIPPFPGHRAPPLAQGAAGQPAGAGLGAALAAARVGGAFWGAQPALAEGTLVLAPSSPAQLAQMLAEAPAGQPLALLGAGTLVGKAPASAQRLPAECDPWWLAEQAAAVWAGADRELALVAALAGRPLRLFGAGAFAGVDQGPQALAAAVSAEVGARAYRCPYTGAPLDAAAAVALMAPWRALIDANRRLGCVLGAARWKRVTLDALLWDGSGPVRHARRLPAAMAPGQVVLAWKSRSAPALLAQAAARGLAVAELEDGFIRSVGLGADCVPPLSVVVDFGGIYFDPATPSDLESLLAGGDPRLDDPALLARAAALRAALVAGAISKYGAGATGGAPACAPTPGRRRVLVTGQVEDDRSVLSGGALRSNLALLQAARAAEPDAHILYRPHPDVEAGHRKGHIPEPQVLALANEICREGPITALIDSVEALHVITSLAGFEALLRGKQVSVHGAPFYAGWGLTRDLAPLPPRRGRAHSLDALVAAALLVYPRYLDPVSRLPCPAEILVQRLASNTAGVRSALVKLRQWQGKARLLVRAAASGWRGG